MSFLSIASNPIRFSTLLLLSGTVHCALLASGASSSDIDFTRDIRPLLSDRCTLCHGPDSGARASDLRLDVEASAHELAIIPGEPDESELIRRIESDDPDEQMPPPDSNLSLTRSERLLLRQWIAEGGRFEAHWAFVTPQMPQTPKPAPKWARNEIDLWVHARLQSAGLSPSPEADRRTLIRRLSFDLTGLPPTVQEVEQFLEDDSAEAYERLVDRLLASQRYGQRMAVDWLDVARYADTYGYQNDRFRSMWPWRDWVVDAINANLPYDQFITWQLAGDLLPDATREQILATAFNRHHRQTNEGGSVEEEFRAEYVADRVNTFGAAFLGLTLECCRCHDHKYDPLTQKEYYQLSAFFNSIDESGLYPHFNEAVPTPALPLPTPQQADAVHAAEAAVSEGEQQLRNWLQQEHDFDSWRDTLIGVRASPKAVTAPTVDLAEMLRRSSMEQLIGSYGLEGDLTSGVTNRVTDGEPGKAVDAPQQVAGPVGKGVELSGENGLEFNTGGDFTRNQPFTISLWMQAPARLERAVVLHRSRAWTDSGSRGFELLIEDGRLSAALIHFWPGNAIRVRSTQEFLPNRWQHVTWTYDGSSRAAGIGLFIDGKKIAVEVIRDKLNKHIKGSDGFSGGDAAKLTIGNRFRDVGFKQGKVDEIRVYRRKLTGLEVGYLYLQDAHPENVQEYLYNAPRQLLREYYLSQHAAQIELETRLAELRRKRSTAADPIREIMVMRELPQPRSTYVLSRGAYDAPAEPVVRATPQSILATKMPPNATRLDLARWLTDPEHPLTARVAVNRFWQAIFGVGLVATTEDFGFQGDPPSNRELLDWLSISFVQSGWDVKELMKTIVMSATYRQRSDPTPHLLEVDPENRLLARGPAVRLPAEMIRDAALAAGGILVERQGGPPVKPYQPAGLWKEKSGSAYKRDEGEGSHRRSLYTYWKRTSPPPSMMTLDASNREVCVVRRQVTTTPLQTLVLLNDPQYVEASKGLAVQATKMHTEVDEQMRYIFATLTTRKPTAAELEILRKIFDEQLEYFTADGRRLEEFLSVGDLEVASELASPSLAALTALAEGLMSYDETIMKR